MLDALTVTRQILEHHGRVFTGFAPLPMPNGTQQDPIYLGALHAASVLGFLAHDAQCVALAWASQSQRCGQFSPEQWPHNPVDFGISGWPRANAFPACPHRLGLYAVLPDSVWVKRMAHAGVPTVQLRFKSQDLSAVAREVHEAVQAVQGTSSLLFINDHWRIAIAEGAYGVHLGQEDLDALTDSELAELRDSGVRLGVSTHGYAEMLRADRVSPSYIALGAVFPTTLKRMATAPQGLARLNAYARLMQHYPLVAIGGIGESQFTDVMQSGVGSIAVVRALVTASEPEQAASHLMERLG